MELKPNGSQPSSKGRPEPFTGTVRIDPLIEASKPGQVHTASVTYEPDAHRAWHHHPLGQINP